MRYKSTVERKEPAEFIPFLEVDIRTWRDSSSMGRSSL